MPRRVLYRDWPAQPQISSRLSSHPLAQRAAYGFLGGVATSLSSGRIWTRNSGVTNSANVAGLSINTSSISGAAMSVTGITTTAQTQFTVVAVVNRTGSNSFATITQSSGTNTGFNLQCNGTALGLSKGGVVDLNTVTLPTGPHIIVASHNQTTGDYYLLARPLGGGAILRTTQTNTAVSTASNGSATISRNSGANAFAGHVGFVVAGFVYLPESAGRELLANPWQLLGPRQTWVPVTVSGTTVLVTGNAIASAVGTVTVQIPATVAVTGNAIASAVGTVTVQIPATVAVTGNAIASAVGTVTVQIPATVAVTGNLLTAALGTPTVVIPATVAVTGNLFTSAVGTVSVVTGTIIAPTGVSLTSSLGTPTIVADTTVAVTGVSFQSFVGSVIFAGPTVVAVSGVSAAFSTGIVTVIAVGWSPIVPPPGAPWAPVDDGQTPGWAPLPPALVGAWSPVVAPPGGGWAVQDMTQDPNWVDNI